ncbi:hypothetical protein SCUP515_09155 [Seiridium cupressi]
MAYETRPIPIPVGQRKLSYEYESADKDQNMIQACKQHIDQHGWSDDFRTLYGHIPEIQGYKPQQPPEYSHGLTAVHQRFLKRYIAPPVKKVQKGVNGRARPRPDSSRHEHGPEVSQEQAVSHRSNATHHQQPTERRTTTSNAETSSTHNATAAAGPTNRRTVRFLLPDDESNSKDSHNRSNQQANESAIASYSELESDADVPPHKPRRASSTHSDRPQTQHAEHAEAESHAGARNAPRGSHPLSNNEAQAPPNIQPGGPSTTNIPQAVFNPQPKLQLSRKEQLQLQKLATRRSVMELRRLANHGRKRTQVPVYRCEPLESPLEYPELEPEPSLW